MSLSSCEKCWDALCVCGYQYRNLTPETRVAIAAAALGIPLHAVEETLSGVTPTDHPLKNNS